MQQGFTSPGTSVSHSRGESWETYTFIFGSGWSQVSNPRCFWQAAGRRQRGQRWGRTKPQGEQCRRWQEEVGHFVQKR